MGAEMQERKGKIKGTGRIFPAYTTIKSSVRTL